MSEIKKAKIRKTQKIFNIKKGQEVEVKFSHRDPIYNQDCYIVIGRDFWLPKSDLLLID